ncbi:MAG: SPASM domain-containing protein [bacterium]
MIEMKDTQGEIKDFLNYWKDYSVKPLVKPFTHWQGDVEAINELAVKPHGVVEGSKICDRLWMWLTVFQDGTVVPCCRDYDGKYPMGNLKDQTIHRSLEWRKDD